MKNQQQKIPVLYYNEPDDNDEGSVTSLFPYIEVEKDEEFPKAIFVQEYRHTNETEMGADGTPHPIIDIQIHMFVNTTVLQQKLTAEEYNRIREAIGIPQQKGNKK